LTVKTILNIMMTVENFF